MRTTKKEHQPNARLGWCSFWRRELCQIRTESLFYLVDSEFRSVVSVVVVNDNNLVVVEDNLIYKVGYKVLTSAFVLDVEGGELLEPKLYTLSREVGVRVVFRLNNLLFENLLLLFEFLEFLLGGVRDDSFFDSGQEVLYIRLNLAEFLAKKCEFGGVSLLVLNLQKLVYYAVDNFGVENVFQGSIDNNVLQRLLLNGLFVATVSLLASEAFIIVMNRTGS